MEHTWVFKDLDFTEANKVDIKTDLIVNGFDLNVYINDVEQGIAPQDMVLSVSFKGRDALLGALVVHIFAEDNKSRLF